MSLRASVAIWTNWSRRSVAIEEVAQEITESRLLLDDSDPEMQEMAELELADLEQEYEQLEETLKLLLVPTDPNDEKNAIVEIRAGTGGDEAGLFAA